MAFDSRSHNHHPGSPLYGGRAASSSSGSHSFLRKLTSFTKRSKTQPLVASSSYTTARSSLPTPPASPPSSSCSAPNRMAIAAAQTASLKATLNAGLPTPPSTARPASSTTRPLSRPKTAASGTPSYAFSGADPVARNAPLAVQVEIRFPGLGGLYSTPSYTHEYSSSQDLQVSDRLCQGLLRRLTDCSTELITRRDSKALMQQQRHGRPASAKLLSYELHFRILCKDSGVWTEKTFCSYQKQDMTSHDAHEVILATHRMVGLFMRRHDPAFRWSDAPEGIASFVPRPEVPELVSSTVDRPLPLSCIPRSRFLDDSQCFEFVPGYAINLSFRSRCHARRQYEWKRAISLQSNQSAPLNLAHAEDLLWRAFESVNSALSIRRQAFYDEHKACEFLEGVVSCQHFDEDALDIELKIQNNLGPNYTHLARSIHSKLALFRHVDGADCQEFIHNVHSHLLQARETADMRVGALPDFDYRITTLETPAWSVDNPARFVLDASTSYSRRSIEAILDRIETGISDVLWNKGCTIHVVAYKRGHLILDKSITTSHDRPKPALFPKAPVNEDADEIIANLKERIHQDIHAVCKDTYSLDPLDNVVDLRESATEAHTTNFVKLSTSSPPMTPTAERFDTVILEESSRIGDEPIVPAPRVVELPADSCLGDSSSSSPASSPRRRAFPLVPEKFVLPPSQGPSPGSSSPPTTKNAALQVPIVEAVASAPEPTVVELAEMLAETLAEIMRDMADPPPFHPLAEVPVDTTETRCEAPSESEALSEAQHDAPEESQTLTEAPVEILEETRGDIAIETPVLASTRAFPEVLPEPSADEGIATLAEGIPADSEPDREEPSQELVTELVSRAEAATLMIPAVEDAKPVELYLPQALLILDGDIESEPDEHEEEVRDSSLGSTTTFYSCDEGSPVAGTMHEAFFESDDASSEFDLNFPSYDQDLPDVPPAEISEFSFDLPSYDQGLPNIPSTDDVQAINTPRGMSETPENDSHHNYDLPAGFDDQLGELDFVSQPVLEEHSITAAEVDDSDGSDFSDDEPLTFSSPSRKSHANALASPTSITNVRSSDLARPSTPCLSPSSRGFNSPETTYLETPKTNRDSYPAIIAYDDTRYGHPYDADGESEHEPHFTALARDQKPVAETSVVGIALDQSRPLDQPLAAPISPTECEISDSGSAVTQICRTADGVITDIDAASTYFKPEPSFQVSQPLAPGLDTPFEDFAMTKPDIDMDEFADVANDEFDAELHNDAALSHGIKAEADADEFQLPDYDGARSFQPEILSGPAEDGFVSFVPRALASFMAGFDGTGEAPERERRRLGSLYRYDVGGESFPLVSKTTPVVETEHVTEVEPIAEIEFVPATETANDPEVPVLTGTITTSPSHDGLVDGFAYNEVAELALSEGGAPSDDTCVIYGEFVEPEVSHGWVELMNSEAEAPSVTNTPALDEDLPVEQDLQVSVVAETPSTTVAVEGASTDDNAANDESPAADDPSTQHSSSNADEPQSCLHVSEATPATVDSFGLCQLGVLPTPPESEDELDVLDHVDVVLEHTDPAVDPRNISFEKEENKTPTQEAASLVFEEEMAYLSSAATSDDTEIQNDAMTDMLGPGRETSDIPDDTAPLLPEENLGSGLDALDLSCPPAEEPLTAGEHTLASENLTPEPLTLDAEAVQLDSAQPEETNGIETTGEVRTRASIPLGRCSMSWFLPKAGIVGLDESKLVRVGLRGALTGSRAFDSLSSSVSDLQPQDTQPAIDDNIDLLSVDEDHEQATAKQEESSAPKQVEGGLPESSPGLPATKNQDANQDVALPRVIMAFATMAVMSQLINRSSSN